MRAINDFLQKYGSLNDAVIKSISLSYNTNPSGLIINIILECMAVYKNDEWIELSLNLYDISEFKIDSRHRFSIDTVQEFSISYLADSIVFDFIPFKMSPKNIEEHRKSLFYIMFERFSFEEIIHN